MTDDREALDRAIAEWWAAEAPLTDISAQHVRDTLMPRVEAVLSRKSRPEADDDTRGAAIDTAFQELANDICRRLPEGWKIEINLERGSGSADLFNPKGDLRDTGPESCEESMFQCVRRLISVAVFHDSRR